MADRKAELERKKAKLQAIKDEKERRRKEKEQKDAEDSALRTANADKDQSKELDEMLSSLGVVPVSDMLSSLSSGTSVGTTEQNNNGTPESSLLNVNVLPSLGQGRKKGPSLSVVSVQSTSIPPRVMETYTKQTQTAHATHERDAQAFGYYVLTYDDGQAEDEEGSSLPPHLDAGYHSKLPPGILPHGLPQVKEMEPAVTAVEQAKDKEVAKTVRELSEEEKLMIVLSEDFQRFMDRAGRIVERALCENVEIYTDYTGNADNEDDGEEKSSGRVNVGRWFSDERWSQGRCVTSLDWSPQYPELLVAAYHSSAGSPHDPDGVCLVWNAKFKKATPEYVFHCQSPVMAATFAKFHPNLILGGTYSGQIVLWDNRVLKRTPVQRTPLSASAHTHPVYCVNMVGTQNAHNLISVSTDGRLCCWSLDMLSQPQETLELHHRQSKPVAVTSLAFPHNDVNNFVLGSEEGAVYSACRHGTKAGVIETYEGGHQGPVTGLDTHKVQGPIDYSHLFLTSSFDWTIKLWNLKENKPLYSFEDNGDYVYDVAWSPHHPGLFAAVDGAGRLDLWNLNADTEVPTASTVVEGSPAINRVAWTPNGGHVTVGDDNGKIWMYDVGEQLALPRHDEWNRLMCTLQELKNNQTDEEMDKIGMSSGPGSFSSIASR